MLTPGDKKNISSWSFDLFHKLLAVTESIFSDLEIEKFPIVKENWQIHFMKCNEKFSIPADQVDFQAFMYQKSQLSRTLYEALYA